MEFTDIVELKDVDGKKNRSNLIFKATMNGARIILKASKGIKELDREIKILRKLQICQFIPQLIQQDIGYGFINSQNSKSDKYYFMVTSPVGVPLNKIHSNDIVKYMTQIFQAVSFAHSNKVYHRDIKPANIIVYDGTAVLIDWGMAVSFKNEWRFNFGMTAGYAASKYLKASYSDKRDFEYQKAHDYESLKYTMIDIVDKFPLFNMEKSGVLPFIQERNQLLLKHCEVWMKVESAVAVSKSKPDFYLQPVGHLNSKVIAGISLP